jgi:4-carboxymuconolactone decarboxylase
MSKIVQTAGHDLLGNFAPEFAHLNDDILFGEVWNRTDKLSLRDRALITVTALIAQGINDKALHYHLTNAKNQGISREEIAEIITHLAFYVGWPKAFASFSLALKIWDDNEVLDDKEKFARACIFPIGADNVNYAQYFTGKSYLYCVSKEQIPIYNVTFEKGCRNAWHIHKATVGGGQMLIALAGEGWYQEEGQAPLAMHPGTVIHIKPNVKHWHGASQNSYFSHLSVEVPGENCENVWFEPLSEEEYLKL